MKKAIIGISTALLIFLFLELVSNFLIYSEYFDAPFSLKEALKKENVKNWIKDLPVLYTKNEDYGKFVTFKKAYHGDWYFRDKERTKSVPKKVTQKPIVVFGCSLTYGDELEPKQTFAYKLSQKTNRIVYNFANIGWGIQHPKFLIENEPILNDIEKPEYIIYVFGYDHPSKVATYNFYPKVNVLELKYPIKNGKLTAPAEKYPLFNRSCFLRILEREIGMYRSAYIDKKNEYRNDKEWQTIFMDWKNSAEKKWKGVKTAILVLPTPNIFTKNTELLEKNNVQIILFSDEKASVLDSRFEEYCLPDGNPNEKYWEIIAQEAAEQMKLKK